MTDIVSIDKNKTDREKIEAILKTNKYAILVINEDNGLVKYQGDGLDIRDLTLMSSFLQAESTLAILESTGEEDE